MPHDVWRGLYMTCIIMGFNFVNFEPRQVSSKPLLTSTTIFCMPMSVIIKYAYEIVLKNEEIQVKIECISRMM